MLDASIEFLAARGVTLATLGGAYLVFLGNLVAAMAFFVASRAWLVVSPNRAAKHYGLYVVMLAASLCIATVLENELVSDMPADATLQYALLPHVLVLMAIHVWIYRQQEPWLIAVGASSVAGAAVVAGAAAPADLVRPAHWLALAGLAALLVYLWYCSVSTKRGFVTAKSIYASSKETPDARVAPQKPWLGTVQWAALVVASVALATVNALLRGSEITEIPAVAVATQSTLILAVTTLVWAAPAAMYWLSHKHWMPELTRFVWLVWLVVGFAFTYGNVLTRLSRA